MRASSALIKPSLLCSLFAALSLQASDASLESYLSELKTQQFDLERDKVRNETDRLQRSVIEPVMLRYNINRSNIADIEQTSQSASVSIDQPIFRSGGIYFAIKYAEAARRYGDDTIAVQERKLIKEAAALLMQIRQGELRLAKQKLLVANAALSVEMKSEQYRSGQLDSTFLDQAIIERNALTLAGYDLETALQRLVSAFGTISDADHRTLKAPKLTLVNADAFLSSNLELRQARSEAEKERYYKETIVAKYLPAVSFNAGYYWDKSENPVFAGGKMTTPDYEQDYYRYGLTISMPLSVGSLYDIDAAHAAYMKASTALQDKEREQRALYEQVLQNIANIDKKIALAESNRVLYAKLAKETKALFDAGYKTTYDVQTLQNSAAIQGLEVQVLQMDRQLELLNLYEKTGNDL